jgi:hypothetical protein
MDGSAFERSAVQARTKFGCNGTNARCPVGVSGAGSGFSQWVGGESNRSKPTSVPATAGAARMASLL